MIRDVLRMGDPRLLERSRASTDSDCAGDRGAARRTCATRCARRTARASPRRRSACSLRVVIFGVDRNPRYPDAEPVPYTELINPVLTPLSDEIEDGWEGCLSVPGYARRRTAPRAAALCGLRPGGRADRARGQRFSRARRPARDATISTASSIRCASATSRRFGFTDVLFPGSCRGQPHDDSQAAATGTPHEIRARPAHSFAAALRRAPSRAAQRLLVVRARAPSIRNTSSARSPSVLILAVCRLMLCAQRARGDATRAGPAGRPRRLEDEVRPLSSGKIWTSGVIGKWRNWRGIRPRRAAAGSAARASCARQLVLDVADACRGTRVRVRRVVHQEGVERVAVARGVHLGVEDAEAGASK